MINLLPPHAKKKVKLDQRLRFAAAFVLVMAAACFVLSVLSLPTLLMQRHQLGSANSDGDLVARLEAGRLERAREAKTVESLVRHFSEKRTERSHAAVIARLDSLAGDDIRLTQFGFDAKNKLTLNGVASTRAALSGFRDLLSADRQFSAVELPLSSLVSERDAAFTITLTIK